MPYYVIYVFPFIILFYMFLHMEKLHFKVKIIYIASTKRVYVLKKPATSIEKVQISTKEVICL